MQIDITGQNGYVRLVSGDDVPTNGYPNSNQTQRCRWFDTLRWVNLSNQMLFSLKRIPVRNASVMICGKGMDERNY